MCHKIDKALAMLFFLLILKTLIVQEMMSDLFLISQRVRVLQNNDCLLAF